VERIAVGAGYGNGVLKDIKADMFITGEVTHHEILREVHRGVSFIVTDHSDTERGYGYVFRERFLDLLKKNNDPQVEIIISEKDRDPLEYI
jgi:putative NIF3 family GTP cyclohydrolase 1 type 2